MNVDTSFWKPAQSKAISVWTPSNTLMEMHNLCHVVPEAVRTHECIISFNVTTQSARHFKRDKKNSSSKIKETLYVPFVSHTTSSQIIYRPNNTEDTWLFMSWFFSCKSPYYFLTPMSPEGSNILKYYKKCDANHTSFGFWAKIVPKLGKFSISLQKFYQVYTLYPLTLNVNESL